MLTPELTWLNNYPNRDYTVKYSCQKCEFVLYLTCDTCPKCNEPVEKAILEQRRWLPGTLSQL